MKILLVLEAALGGSGRHVLDLAEGLLTRRHEVNLVYSPLRADQAFLRRLASLSMTWPDLLCKSIAITRSVTISDVRSYLDLWRFVRANGPFDVIHAHSTKAGFLTRLLLGTQGAKMIYTPHGLMTLDPSLTGVRRRAVCALESTLARWSDTVICVSIGEHQCAIDTGIHSTKLVVVPNGISQCAAGTHARRREEIRASLGLSSDTTVIGYVGRFVSYKKSHRVIEAFALLKQKTAKPSRLVMIGWGPLEPDLQRLAVELAVEKDVLFPGQVDGPTYIPALDVLAHASSFEAFGYVFVEALSSGVPIVTTRVGGTDELISNGVTGYVCDPWEPGAFADYLKLLVEDPDRRSAMSAVARERAAQYSVEHMVDSVAELYRQLGARPHLTAAVSANRQTL
jgi:glycosyltransferase involved in cell wall biosynthesis